MMGERRVMQEALFFGFSLDRHVPDNHMLRRIDRFVDLSDVRAHLEPHYSEVGQPSIDPAGKSSATLSRASVLCPPARRSPSERSMSSG